MGCLLGCFQMMYWEPRLLLLLSLLQKVFSLFFVSLFQQFLSHALSPSFIHKGGVTLHNPVDVIKEFAENYVFLTEDSEVNFNAAINPLFTQRMFRYQFCHSCFYYSIVLLYHYPPLPS